MGIGPLMWARQRGAGTLGFKHATFNDFLPATFKTAVFGLIIGLVACFQGMRAQGGTEGVERAATSSVVLSSLFIRFR